MSEIISKKICVPGNLGTISTITIGILSDFENNYLPANRKQVTITLTPQGIKLFENIEELQDKIKSHAPFRDYVARLLSMSKFYNDFDETSRSSTKETWLILSLEELSYLNESENFKQKLNDLDFCNYLEQVIENSFDTFSESKSDIDSNQKELLSLYCLFIGKDILGLGYSFFDCTDEDTGKVETILVKN